MIRHDRPIKHVKDDILGRGEFVQAFVKCIDGDVSLGHGMAKESLVIGLQGSWGCGKTSLINMISEKLMSGEYANRYIVKYLEAWADINSESLLLEFFNTLLSATIYQNDFDKASVVSIIKDIVCKNSSYVSKALSFLATQAVGEIAPGEDKLEDLLFKETFEEKKEKVSKALENFPKTIVYFIDDIDRLSDKEISLLFRLVKTIADFPNVIYILCYDRDIVCRSMKRIQMGKGEAYLEKIVQVPFDVPNPSRETLCKYCVEGIIMVLRMDESKKESYMIFVRNLILPFMKNLRDCNRFLNVLFFRYLICGKDVNIPDLIGITLLEVFDKGTYDLIYENKEALYPKRDESTTATEHRQKLAGTSGMSRLVIDIMFPKLFPTQNLSEIGLMKSVFAPEIHPISHEENFNLYFQMNVSERQVAWKEIHKTFAESSEEEMLARFMYWHENNLWWDVADQVRKSFSMARHDRTLFIDKLRCKDILKALSRLEEGLTYSDRIRMQTNFEFFVEPMLKKVLTDENKKVDVPFLKELFQDREISISFTSLVMHHLTRGKPWDPWKTNLWGIDSDVDIREEDFKKVEEILETRIRESIKGMKIFSLGAFNNLLNYCGERMPGIIEEYLSDNGDEDSSKERFSIGIMMCISCFCGHDHNVCWKKHPTRWKMISHPENRSSVFKEYWAEDRIKKQESDIQLTVNVTKRLFSMDMVSLEDVMDDPR